MAGSFFLHPVASVVARGVDAVDLLNRLGTQDLRHMAAGETRFGMFVTHQGKLVACVRAVAQPDGLLLLTDPLQGRALCDWLERYTVTEDATFELLEESRPSLRLLAAAEAEGDGPAAGGAPFVQAAEALRRWSPIRIDCARGWSGAADALVPIGQEAPAARALLGAGWRALDEGDAERLRIEVGEPAMGHELAPLGAPLEWRLGAGTICWTKGCFVGQEVLGRLDNFNKVARLSMGVRAPAGAAALATAEGRAGARIGQAGATVGRIASVAATDGDAWTGLGLVKSSAAEAGAAQLKLADGTELPLTLEHRPFWRA